jgi:hypothetical protein
MPDDTLPTQKLTSVPHPVGIDSQTASPAANRTGTEQVPLADVVDLMYGVGVETARNAASSRLQIELNEKRWM